MFASSHRHSQVRKLVRNLLQNSLVGCDEEIILASGFLDCLQDGVFNGSFARSSGGLDRRRLVVGYEFKYFPLACPHAWITGRSREISFETPERKMLRMVHCFFGRQVVNFLGRLQCKNPPA